MTTAMSTLEATKAETTTTLVVLWPVGTIGISVLSGGQWSGSEYKDSHNGKGDESV